MKKRDHTAHFGFSGGSILMVILAVLCLVIFATTALSSAMANGRLSDAYADGVAEYYDADLKAQIIISAIRSGQLPENVSESEGKFRFSIPVGETRELTVELSVNGSDYEIQKYNVVYTGEWTPSKDMALWQPDTED